MLRGAMAPLDTRLSYLRLSLEPSGSRKPYLGVHGTGISSERLLFFPIAAGWVSGRPHARRCRERRLLVADGPTAFGRPDNDS